MKDRF